MSITMDLIKTGLFISTLRKEKDMTQKELAEKIGVTDKAVSRWETGKGFPDVSLLTTLAEALCVSVSEIIIGEKIETDEKNTVEIMEKAVIDTLDYSQREISKSIRWKRVVIGFAILLFSTAVLFAIYSTVLNLSLLSLYGLLVFFIIPVGIPVFWYLTKRRRFWLSPVTVFVVGTIISVAIEWPSFVTFFSGYQDGSTSRTVVTFLFIPLLISIIAAAICQAVKILRVHEG